MSLLSFNCNDFELATRLSYFLWSSMPDEQLFKRAASGQLGQATVLEAEIRRMLADPRCEEFVTHFADQWFDLDALHRVAVNPEVFAEFDDQLKADMADETRAYLREILHGDRSCLELLDSDCSTLG